MQIADSVYCISFERFCKVLKGFEKQSRFLTETAWLKAKRARRGKNFPRGGRGVVQLKLYQKRVEKGPCLSVCGVYSLICLYLSPKRAGPRRDHSSCLSSSVPPCKKPRLSITYAEFMDWNRKKCPGVSTA